MNLDIIQSVKIFLFAVFFYLMTINLMIKFNSIFMKNLENYFRQKYLQQLNLQKYHPIQLNELIDQRQPRSCRLVNYNDEQFNIGIHYTMVLNSMKIVPVTLILMMYPECLSPYSPMAGRQAIRKDFFIHSRTDSIHFHYTFYPKPIGKGAYGTVYLAKMKEPPFADRVVKVIQKRLVRNPQSLKNEVAILRTLDHPNIVKLYETFEDQSCLYLVQDYCEGGQLFDYLDQIGKLSQQKARQIFIQMVKVVRCLHLQNIAHRDLKAENFLFAKKDHQKLVLIDFGLAFQWKDDMESQLYQLGQNKIIGTPYYISPEVLAKRYDQRCDVWSLGVLLHIISTAAAPFNGKTDSQIISSIRQNKLNRTLQFEQLSPNLKDLIQKMLTVRQERISLEEVLSHPWMKNQQEQIPQLMLNYSKLRQFAASSRPKAVCLSFIAAQMPSRDNQQIGELFKQINSSGSGWLSVPEIQRQLKSQGLDIDPSQLHRVLKVVDMDKNGRINFNQFVASSLHSSYCTRSQYLIHIFSHFDLDHNGKISADQLTQQIGKMGLQLPTRLVRQIMQEADLDKDGFITYQQFTETLTHI